MADKAVPLERDEVVAYAAHIQIEGQRELFCPRFPQRLQRPQQALASGGLGGERGSHILRHLRMIAHTSASN